MDAKDRVRTRRLRLRHQVQLARVRTELRNLPSIPRVPLALSGPINPRLRLLRITPTIPFRDQARHVLVSLCIARHPSAIRDPSRLHHSRWVVNHAHGLAQARQTR